jgi:hypothetical protein
MTVRFNKIQFNKDMDATSKYLKIGLAKLSRTLGIWFIFPLLVGWLAIYIPFGVNILNQWDYAMMFTAIFLTWMIGLLVGAVLYGIFKTGQWFGRRWWIVNGGRKHGK